MAVWTLIRRGIWLVAAVAVLWGVLRLELDRAEVPERILTTPAGDVHLYGAGTGPLVFVTHGFAGSEQLMQTISRDLARAGFTVASFDFVGHGRHAGFLSSDVTRIEGTTEQLITQTLRVIDAVRPEIAWQGDIGLLGHSMATDIIIRAAERRTDVAAIVAISMYSEAVTDSAPSRLLILSGEWEQRLRQVALDVVRLVDPEAEEGQTVQSGDVVRRANYAPLTEHLAVLYSPVTLNETRDWLGAGLDHAPMGTAKSPGLAILAVLAGLTALSTLVARVVPQRPRAEVVLTPLQFLVIAVLPAVPASAAAMLVGGTVLGVAAFGSLVAFFGVWGAVSLALAWRWGVRLSGFDPLGFVVLLVLGLGVFAVALDRYGAAFVPVGPRAALMSILVLGTVPFMLADRLLVSGAPLWRRFVARIVPVVALLAIMIVGPMHLGLLFTVLPVLVLFYCVYGTMGHVVAARSGPNTAGLALGVCLAWAIAASTPLFAG